MAEGSWSSIVNFVYVDTRPSEVGLDDGPDNPNRETLLSDTRSLRWLRTIEERSFQLVDKLGELEAEVTLGQSYMPVGLAAVIRLIEGSVGHVFLPLAHRHHPST